ncbi:ABC transporter ATP-binding protein, partial [Mycolicibacterium elephantis]
ARERAARKASTAARNVKNAGLPRIVAGAMKRRAQESAGKADDVHTARVGDAKARLDDAERRLRNDDALVLDLPHTDVPAGRNLLTLDGVTARRGGRT